MPHSLPPSPEAEDPDASRHTSLLFIFKGAGQVSPFLVLGGIRDVSGGESVRELGSI